MTDYAEPGSGSPRGPKKEKKPKKLPGLGPAPVTEQELMQSGDYPPAPAAETVEPPPAATAVDQRTVGAWTHPVRIWQMNAQEWVAAEDLNGAKLALANQINEGKTDQSLDEFMDEPRMLTDEEMDTLVYSDDLSDPKTEKRSYRQELFLRINRGEKFPQYFASSEF